MYKFVPPTTQRYLLEFHKCSKKGNLLKTDNKVTLTGDPQNPEWVYLTTLETDILAGEPSCKAMGKQAIQYDPYETNCYYFQYRVEADLEQPSTGKDEHALPNAPVSARNGIKMSVGLCRDGLDLDKNLIMMNKKKEYWIVDLFDGELYSHRNQMGDTYKHYIPDDNLVVVGDIIGV